MRIKDIADVWVDEVIWVKAIPRLGGPRGPTKPRRDFEEGDIIITRIGGKVTLYDPKTPLASLPRNFIVVRLKSGFKQKFDSRFIKLNLEKILQGNTEARVRGSSQQAARVRGIKEIPVSGRTTLENQKNWADNNYKLKELVRAEEEKTALTRALMKSTMRNLPDLRRTQGAIKSAQRRIDGENFMRVRSGGIYNRRSAAAIAEHIRRNNLKSRILTNDKGNWSVYVGGLRKRKYLTPNP